MKKFLILIILISCVQLCEAKENVTFPYDFFENQIHEFPKSEQDLLNLSSKELPWDIVSQYLVQIKNYQEYYWNDFTMSPKFYRALGSMEYNNTIYLFYSITGFFEHQYQIYICPWKESNVYPSTLMLYDVNYSTKTFFRTTEDTISIFYVYENGIAPSVKTDSFLIAPEFPITYSTLEEDFDKVVQEEFSPSFSSSNPISYFKKNEKFPKVEFIRDVEHQLLPKASAGLYFYQMKNMNELSSCNSTNYEALGKVRSNNVDFLMISRKDSMNSVFEVFLCPWKSKQIPFPPLLRIFRTKNNVREILYSINDSLITLINIRYGADLPFAVREIYKMDSIFTKLHPNDNVNGLIDEFALKVDSIEMEIYPQQKR